MPRLAPIPFLVAALLIGTTGCPQHVVCRSCKVTQNVVEWQVDSLASGEVVSMMYLDLVNERGEPVTFDYPMPASSTGPLTDDRLCKVRVSPTAGGQIRFIIALPTGGTREEQWDLATIQPCS